MVQPGQRVSSTGRVAPPQGGEYSRRHGCQSVHEMEPAGSRPAGRAYGAGLVDAGVGGRDVQGHRSQLDRCRQCHHTALRALGCQVHLLHQPAHHSHHTVDYVYRCPRRRAVLRAGHRPPAAGTITIAGGRNADGQPKPFKFQNSKGSLGNTFAIISFPGTVHSASLPSGKYRFDVVVGGKVAAMATLVLVTRAGC